MYLGREGRSVLIVEGEVDLATAPRLAAELADPAITCVDLSRVEFAGAALASALLAADTRPDRPRLVLRSPSRAVRRLLALCELDRAFLVEDDNEPQSSRPLT